MDVAGSSKNNVSSKRRAGPTQVSRPIPPKPMRGALKTHVKRIRSAPPSRFHTPFASRKSALAMPLFTIVSPATYASWPRHALRRRPCRYQASPSSADNKKVTIHFEERSPRSIGCHGSHYARSLFHYAPPRHLFGRWTGDALFARRICRQQNRRRYGAAALHGTSST